MASFIEPVEAKEEEDGGFWDALGDMFGTAITLGTEYVAGTIAAGGNPLGGIALSALGGAVGSVAKGKDLGAAIGGGVAQASSSMAPLAYQNLLKSQEKKREFAATMGNLQKSFARGTVQNIANSPKTTWSVGG